MPITLNHTIVPSHDKEGSARFFARSWAWRTRADGHFAQVRVNQTSGWIGTTAPSSRHHYAFGQRPGVR